MIFNYFMSGITILFVFFIVVVTAYRRDKRFLLLVVPLFISITFLCLNEMLAFPKDITWEVRETKGKIIAYKVIEDEVIYLWILPEGEQEPRYYRLPYTEESRNKLNRMQRFGQPYVFEWSLGKKEKMYPPPQPKMPTKNKPNNTIQMLNQNNRPGNP